jgi:hypothetical protein
MRWIAVIPAVLGPGEGLALDRAITVWMCAAWGGSGRFAALTLLAARAAPVRSMAPVSVSGRVVLFVLAKPPQLPSGHPQLNFWRCCTRPGPSGDVYCGKAVFACVARQLSTVKGESMLISKCRRRWPVGSSGSMRDILITICTKHVSS